MTDGYRPRPSGTGPALVVRSQAAGWSLVAGPAYLIGRDPACAVVIADDRVSWQHAVLRFEQDRWVLADNGSTNGTYAGDLRVDREFAASGVLDHVHIAASRERPEHREYVQDHIREQGALVCRLLTAGGYVYVCGSQPMLEAVRDAFVDVAADHGLLPREHAEAYLAELEATARYRPDLWTDLREPAWTYWPSS